MNNSDLIAALSLAITAIIFLVQTDDGLLKLKTKRYEKWILFSLLVIIILLINFQEFERFKVTFYFNIKDKYLLPTEWALLLFLYLIGVTLYRIFTPKVFNDDSKTIKGLITKYRREKKWNKLQNLLLTVMNLKDFEENYAEYFDDTIFNDYHLIEYFASDFPEILIKFCERFPQASIAGGEHFFHILNGLFADKSNPIFSEIRHYHNDKDKKLFLEELWMLRLHEGFRFDPKKDYNTNLPIISWLTFIIQSHPTSLKEEIIYFFRQFPETASPKNNDEIYTEKEIERLLSRDKVFNVIQLFRSILIEYCFVEKRALILIDRVLLLLYSSWEHIEKSTRYESKIKVALNNDSYSINEYFLKYLFYSYLSLYFLLKYLRPFRLNQGDENNEGSSWPIKQLFAKLDSILGHLGIVADASKQYYMERLFELYFEMPDYFKGNEKAAEELSEDLLWYIKDSLNSSPYGDAKLIRKEFNRACDSFDFLKFNNHRMSLRVKRFYEYLLPYTQAYAWRIKHSLH